MHFIWLDWWVFLAANAIQASTALTATNAAMPPDKTFSGQIAPVQYTRCWDNGVVVLTDGRLAFTAKPNTTAPAAVSTTLTAAAAAPLLPGTLPGPC